MELTSAKSPHTKLLSLTSDIVTSHVSNNLVALADLPSLISIVFSSLAGLGVPSESKTEMQKPAVSVRASIKPDYIVCLEDGRQLKILKRHLMSNYGMTPIAYRAKWGLPADYPMVAPNYSERRRNLAIQIGLGNRHASVESSLPAKVTRHRSKGVALPPVK